MDVGLSREMIAMIDERLGASWGKAAIFSVTLALIASPIIIVVTAGALVVGVWGWSVNQLSGVVGLTLAWAVGSSFAALVLFELFSRFYMNPRAEEIVREAKELIIEMQTMMNQREAGGAQARRDEEMSPD